MAKRSAEWRLCPGVLESRYAHQMRDYCWTCAPYWEVVPTCPVHGSKLAHSGWCAKCRRYYDKGDWPTTEALLAVHEAERLTRNEVK